MKIKFLPLLFLLLLTGCQPKIITQEILVPVYTPPVHDTIALRDTVFEKDSLWYGEVTDSLGGVIGDLKVYYQRKIAELKLKSKTDTVTIMNTDTIPGKVLPPEIIKVAVSYFSWWELALLGAIASALIAFKIKRGSFLGLFRKSL